MKRSFHRSHFNILFWHWLKLFSTLKITKLSTAPYKAVLTFVRFLRNCFQTINCSENRSDGHKNLPRKSSKFQNFKLP